MRSNIKTPAKQHAEWLSIVEVSGPFLTLAVLNQHLKIGLDAHDSDLYRSVKEAYEEWESSSSPAIHTAWIRFLLTNVLGYPSECIGEAQAIPESAVANLELQGHRIRPNLVILDPDDLQKVKMPILIYPRSQKLDSPIAGESWAASPHTRMQVLLQNTGHQVGFVTNGAQWSLVHVRKGEPTGFATWQTIFLTEEKILLQSFCGILGVDRTVGAPLGASLEDLLDQSAQDQEEVTKELGRQVRQAVEVLVNALDRVDQDSHRALLADVDPQTVYNGALTVMMRLIFLLCAEERDLMDNRALYVQHYSVSELNDQLRVIASGDEQILEHRHDAWQRLLATFRLVHGGCDHENLNLPAYGGSLFDPQKYPFLEQAKIDNRVTLHLLDALEFLLVRVPGGKPEPRRLSFRALGVEQIGHVYEGLLDHTARRAAEPAVGLTGRESQEDEIALSVLEENRENLASYFEKQKIRVSGNVGKLLQQSPDMLAASKLRVACGTDDELYQRVLPFVNVIREDSLEHLQVYPIGSLYVTAGSDRRSSGTHYTPVSLTEEVVRYALEPLVYIGPAEGLPEREWKLKSAKAIVDLKVCDMAMGSGAFLVQACRYLSERLVEAWNQAIKDAERPLGFSGEGSYFTHQLETDQNTAGGRTLITTPLGKIAVGDPSQELIPDIPEERLALARRIIADRCLYGVDINPMAVEMAKLSLWLTTMRKD
ncbi:MAG: restriction endonuclease, partial [Fimbriimonadaceae bacterium]